jgi:hypothetical protein
VRVHDRNRISAPRTAEQKYRDRMLMWVELYGWCKRRRLGAAQQRIMDQMLEIATSIEWMDDRSKVTGTRRFLRVRQLLSWLARRPRMALEPQLWQTVRGLYAQGVQSRATGRERT